MKITGFSSRIADYRRFEKPFRVHRRRGPHHLQSGHVIEVALHRLRVLGGELMRRSARAAHHDGDRVLPARHVVHLRGRIHDLIERQQREVERHHLHDRPQADHGRADAHAGEARLRDRRVDDALGAELLQKALRHLVGALVEPDLLADDEHARVAVHLLAEGQVECFPVGHHRHGVSPCRCR
jgi:hypothetical protein